MTDLNFRVQLAPNQYATDDWEVRPSGLGLAPWGPPSVVAEPVASRPPAVPERPRRAGSPA